MSAIEPLIGYHIVGGDWIIGVRVPAWPLPRGVALVNADGFVVALAVYHWSLWRRLRIVLRHPRSLVFAVSAPDEPYTVRVIR